MAARQSTAARADIEHARIDSIEHPDLMAAATSDAERMALAVAIGWDQAAMAAERLATRAAERAGDGDLDALAVREWLHPLALGARRVADQAAISCLIDLATHTTAQSDTGAIVRRIAAARYGVRLGDQIGKR